MSDIVLKIVVRAKRSPCENGERIDVGLFLSITHDLNDIGKLLKIKTWGWLTTLRRVLKAFLLDERSE